MHPFDLQADLPFPLPVVEPEWRLIEEGFNLAREHEIESLFSVSNGYIGTRGAVAEGSSLSAPATFIAGLFDVEPRHSIPELAVGPDWMLLKLKIGGAELSLEHSPTQLHRRMLDMCHGMLWREWQVEPKPGCVLRLQKFRLASLVDRHLLLQSVLFQPVHGKMRLHVETFLRPPSERAEHLEMIPIESRNEDGGAEVLILQTHTGRRIAFAARSQLWADDGHGWRVQSVDGAPREHDPWMLDVRPRSTYRLDRFVTVYTSRDSGQPDAAALKALRRTSAEGIARPVAEHVARWRTRWHNADLHIEGDLDAQRALRFACYHLIGAANPEDESVSVGARALTGAAYKGHVFWDTELFMLPFYIYTHPPSARALLMYRYHTLPAARLNAARLNYRGALYAWESAETGEETTPPSVVDPTTGERVPILSGLQEHHISAAVAYGVCHYWRATGDEEFLFEAGAEIILETARFWASRGQTEGDGRYHIRHVVGPDEYHENVDDNAYTNGMARWNLETAVELARHLAQMQPERWRELAGRLGVTAGELQQWQDVARSMYTGYDPERGLIEQFQGYFGLQFIDLGHYAARSVPMDVILGRRRTARTQIIKQADVLMLIDLLWDRFEPGVRTANFRYYEPRCGHGSSLSPCIHALLAARLGDMERAVPLFRQAAAIDLSNNMGNAAGGVHAAALGGLWQAVVFGFAGVRLRGAGLIVDPHLPPGWEALRFTLLWRGQRLQIQVTDDLLELACEGNEGARIAPGGGDARLVGAGEKVRWRRKAQGWEVQDHGHQ